MSEEEIEVPQTCSTAAPPVDDLEEDGLDKATLRARMAGEAVEFFTLCILSRPEATWTEGDRRFLRSIIPLLAARKRALEKTIIDLQMHRQRREEPEA